MPNRDWGEISQFEDSAQSCGFLLWKAQLIWRRMIEKALFEYDLTHTQFVLLASTAYLTRNNKVVNQVELASYTSCDVNTTSQVLRSLQKKGLITRSNKTDNEKAKYPQLTDQGYTLLTQAIQTVERIDKNFFSSLTSTEQESFRTTILQLLRGTA